MARLRGKKWQADAFYQGARKRPTFATKEEAEAWEKQVALADSRGDPLPPIASANGKKIEAGYTLQGFISEHYAHLWGDKRSDVAAKNLNQIVKLLGPKFPITDFDYATTVHISNEFKKQGNSNSTINRKMCALSKLLKHAEKLGKLDRAPKPDRFTENQGRVRYLTDREERELMARFEHLGLIDSYHMNNFLLYTGCRWSETQEIRRRDVEYTTKVFSLWETKSGHPRSIPFTRKALAAAEYFMRKHNRDLVFDLPYDTHNDQWERVRADLGFSDDPHFVPYVLRHTCASRLVQKGVDLRRVQQWMGHKAIATTLRYAHLAPGDLNIAAQALEA